MKTILVLCLVAVLTLGGTIPVSAASNSSGVACPSWASNLGEKCLTLTASYRPGSANDPTTIDIVTWPTGQIHLRNADLTAHGLTFFDPERNKIAPANMQEGVWYVFVQDETDAKISLVWRNSSLLARIFSPSCHLQLAKPAE